MIKLYKDNDNSSNSSIRDTNKIITMMMTIMALRGEIHLETLKISTNNFSYDVSYNVLRTPLQNFQAKFVIILIL